MGLRLGLRGEAGVAVAVGEAGVVKEAERALSTDRRGLKFGRSMVARWDEAKMIRWNSGRGGLLTRGCSLERADCRALLSFYPSLFYPISFLFTSSFLLPWLRSYLIDVLISGPGWARLGGPGFK